jgi:hypothetical protein
MGDLRDISIRNAEGIARLKAGDPVAARDIWIDALMQLEELFVVCTTDDEDLSDSDESLDERYDCDMDDSSSANENEAESDGSLDFSDDDEEDDEISSSCVVVDESLEPCTRSTPLPALDAVASQSEPQQIAIHTEGVQVEPCVHEKRRRVDSNETPTSAAHAEQPQTVAPSAVSVSSVTTNIPQLGSMYPVCTFPGAQAVAIPQQQHQQQLSMQRAAGGVYVEQSATSIYNRTWQLPAEGPYELQHLSAAVLFNLALIHHRAALYANNLADQANSLFEAVRWYRKAHDFLREDSLMEAWVLYLRAALVFNLMHIYSTLGDFSTLFSLCQELQQIRIMLSTVSFSSTKGQCTNSSAMMTPTANSSSSLCWNAPTNEDGPDIEFLQKSMLSLSVMGPAAASR